MLPEVEQHLHDVLVQLHLVRLLLYHRRLCGLCFVFVVALTCLLAFTCLTLLLVLLEVIRIVIIPKEIRLTNIDSSAQQLYQTRESSKAT